MTKRKPASAILLIHCPDQTGIVAAVTEFIGTHDGNILYLDQHVDLEKKVFFMRIEWDLANFTIPREMIHSEFQQKIGERFNMNFKLHFSDVKLRMAVFVSELPHCLYDILSRWQSDEWDVDIPLIISNHNTLKNTADKFEIPYHTLPVNSKNKSEQEKQQLELLNKNDIDFIVLARYMQILSDDFVSSFRNRIINDPSFVSSRLSRSKALSFCIRKRRKDNWINQPFCNSGVGCRSDNRAGYNTHKPCRFYQ